jgi:2-(1,2-epoxy-1,2-dihydrophenyl)acetyl-CoA isomerase
LEHGTVKALLKNGVEWITLDRPDKLNAFDEQMGADLMAVLKEAERRPDVRCLVITGEGRAFSVGEDLNTNKEAYATGEPLTLGETLIRKYNPIVSRIRRMDKPVVAGINGVTAGAGLGLALACDLRAASSKASFHEAFIKVGLAPDSGTSFWLTRIVGLAKAMEIGMLGEPIDAGAALNLGLVNWVFPEESFAAELTKIAERLASGPTKALGLTKRALNRAIVVDMDSALEYESYLQEIAGRSRDHVEGVRAFFEKRQPEFTGA